VCLKGRYTLKKCKGILQKEYKNAGNFEEGGRMGPEWNKLLGEPYSSGHFAVSNTRRKKRGFGGRVGVSASISYRKFQKTIGQVRGFVNNKNLRQEIKKIIWT